MVLDGEVQGVGASCGGRPVSCRTPRGQRRRWRVGPRRVLAGRRGRAVKNDEHGGATVACYSGRVGSANGLAGAGAARCPLAWRGREVLAHPCHCQWGQGAEVASVGTGKGQESGHDPTFLVLAIISIFQFWSIRF